jgi:hypothetical protein
VIPAVQKGAGRHAILGIEPWKVIFWGRLHDRVYEDLVGTGIEVA